jgi:hypothetical protein
LRRRSSNSLPTSPRRRSHACLITEQKVLFATAAALPLQPAKTSRRWTEVVRAIGASVRAAVVMSSDEARPKRQHYPARNDYLDDSCMAREMLRL